MATTLTYPDIHVTGAVHHWVRTREIGSAPWYLGTAEITPQMLLTQYYADSPATAAGSTLPFNKQYEGQAATVSVLLSRWSKFTEAAMLWAGGEAGGIRGGAAQKPVAGPVKKNVFVGTGIIGIGNQATVFSGGVETVVKPLKQDNPPGVGTGGDFDSGPTVVTGLIQGIVDAVLKAGEDPPPPPAPASYVSGTETRWSRGSWVFGSKDFELWQVFDFSLFPTARSAGLEIGWYWPQVTLDHHDTMAAGTQGKKLLLVFSCEPQYLQDPFEISTNQSPSGRNALPTPPKPSGNERGWVLWSNKTDDFPAAVRVPQ